MDLFKLRASLTLDKTDYENKLKDAKESGKDFSEKTKKQIGIISADAWTNLAGKVLQVTKSIINAGLETMNYADQIGDLAGKWGFTTQQIQEFDYWATMNGTTLESLLTGMRGLVNQAEAGSSAFQKLGVNVKNADGTFKDQRTLFLQTIDALNKMQNQTERNALQFEIFGRAGIELGQVISRDASELEALSRQAEEFGIILSEETIQKAGDFNDALDRLRLQGKSAFAELIAGTEGAEEKFDEYIANLEVAFNRLMPVFVEVGTQLGKAIIKGLGKALGNKLVDTIKWSLGKGWLWGEKESNNIFENFWESGFGGGSSGGGNTSIFESQSALSNSTDNSTTNVTVNMNSSGYTSEDARAIADEVIKEIVTKKQASGR